MTQKTELFKKFLETKNLLIDFEDEIIENHLGGEVDNEELSDFWENLEEHSEILDNGYFFFYKGRNKNSITNINWSNLNKQWKTIEKATFKTLVLEWSISDYNTAWSIEKQSYEIGDVVCFMSKWYIVTKQITKSGTMKAFEVKNNGELSKARGIQLTDTVVSKITIKKRYQS